MKKVFRIQLFLFIVTLVFLFVACKTKEKEPPESFQAASNQDLQQGLGCTEIVDIVEGGTEFKIIIYEEGKNDYLVACYQNDGASFRVYGVPVHLVGFSRPNLVKAPRQSLFTTHLNTKEVYLFQVVPKFELVPRAGGWQPTNE